MTPASRSSLIVLTVTAVVSVAGLASAQEQITVPFTDPGRPGTVRASTLNGTITVHGADRRDVLIETRARQGGVTRGGGANSGLRRLQPVGGFEAIEENNTMVISSNANESVELVITVPTRTNLKITSVNGGNITVEGVDSDIEVNNTNNGITLTNVAGSVVAHSTNGNVKATLTRVTGAKPMAFTSFNGNVDVSLPASLKATFKLRSDMGDVYTDFDLQLKTETTTTPNPQRENGKLRIEVNRSQTGTVNGGGPEIELRTFNGNIYLRKGAQ
jgi:DUF4097 and DUF4098 domain-containing protein YvlB